MAHLNNREVKDVIVRSDHNSAANNSAANNNPPSTSSSTSGQRNAPAPIANQPQRITVSASGYPYSPLVKLIHHYLDLLDIFFYEIQFMSLVIY